MKKSTLLVMAVVALPGAAHAQSADEPFYAAFKTFCVDTGAAPDLVKAAVEAVPLATPHGPSGTSPALSLLVRHPGTVAGWDITLNGHQYLVVTATSHAPYDSNQLSVSCNISSHTNEDASVAAIREWVGVQPDPKYLSSMGIMLYMYRQDGSARTAVNGDAAEKSAIAEGKAWGLMVMQQPNVTSIQLMHMLAPSPGKSN